MTTRALIAAALMLAPAVPAASQDRAGNDTAGDWVVTHYAPFGLWDSICDERPEANGIHQRCYIRYVEVFSPRPKLAAHFAFVTPDKGGVRIEYGSEAGTRFVRDGNRVERDGQPVWTAKRAGCLSGGRCVFEGAEAQKFYGQLQDADTWRFDFADRHGVLQSLEWDMTRFSEAAADFEREVAARGL